VQYDISAPGLEGRRIQVAGGGPRKRPSLLVDGMPAPEGTNPGEYLIHRNDGASVIATVARSRTPLDPVPRVTIAGEEIAVRPRLTGAQVVWSGLPLLLGVTSGVLGIVVGTAAMVQNLRIFRRGSGRYPRTLMVSLAAALLVGVISIGGLLLTGTGNQANAERAVAHLHEQLNGGNFEAIVAESDPLFTSKVSRAEAVRFLSAVHTTLGSAGSASLDGWTMNGQLNGSIGTGNFMNMLYTTQFESGSAKERFTWRVTDDGRMLLVGYNVESPVFLR
jgi:hypothetical protein